AVLSAAFGAVAQKTAQAHVSPSEAGLLCSLESVFCALFSVAFFGEALTPRMALGFALIFASVVATQLGDKGGSTAAAAAADSTLDESAADRPAATASRESSEPGKRNRGRIAR
ncbi:MAG: DMT family transporter, partial [Ellagibacter isourolithinifaciens]|nr:DMT family transporter [Ellagibacter isourolithinifaciens]